MEGWGRRSPSPVWGEGGGGGVASPQGRTRGGESAFPRSSDSRRSPLTRNLREERANSDLSPQAGRGKAGADRQSRFKARREPLTATPIDLAAPPDTLLRQIALRLRLHLRWHRRRSTKQDRGNPNACE